MTIYDLSQSYRDDLLAGEKPAIKSLAVNYQAAWKALQPKITSVLEEIQKLREEGQEPTPDLVFRMKRYLALEEQINEQKDRLNDILYGATQQNVIKAVPQAVKASAAMLKKIAKNGGIEVSFATLDQRTIEAITANLLENSPLTALLQRASSAGVQRLRETLIEGVTLGYNSRKIASQMRATLGGNLNRALTIARTETLRAYREGTHQTYQANQHLITGWYWTASLSRRTCGACIALHGQFFPAGERQYSHVRCRCTSVPAIKGAPPPFEETGEQWFAKQPDDVQASIIRNRSTMDALRSGELRLRDVVGKQESPTWGPSFVQLGTRRSLAGQGSFPTFGNADEPLGIEEIIAKAKAEAAVNLPKPKKPKTPKAVAQPGEAPAAQAIPGKRKGAKTIQAQAAPAAPARVRGTQIPDFADADFPETIDGLQDIQRLGGSTGARLVQDPVTGKRYVLKRGSSPDHLREEFYADALYNALGVNVPKARLYETTQGPVKLAEFIEGKTLNRFSPEEIARFKKDIQKHMATDAVMGNWDVIGEVADNVLVTPAGKIYRIDNGGSLRFRAKGEPKGALWNDHPIEFWTLRNQKMNPTAFEIFKDTSIYDIGKQIRELETKRAAIEALNLPRDLERTIMARLSNANRIADIAADFEADGWVASYVDEVARHAMSLRQAGVIDKMADSLNIATRKTTSRSFGKAIDKNGRPFDNFRTNEYKGLTNVSVVDDFHDYLRSQDGKIDLLSGWGSEQGNSSWTDTSVSIKYFYHKQMGNTRFDEFYWQEMSEDTVKWRLEQTKMKFSTLVGKNQKIPMTDAQMRTTLAANHALTMEMLAKTQFTGNNRSTRILELHRTEGAKVLQMYGIEVGKKQKNIIFRRGPNESGSAVDYVVAEAGNEHTIQQVPHHRITGSYFFERSSSGSKDRGRGFFLTDKEVEFTFIPYKIRFNYNGTVKTIW
jgi:SPP1 gp7 family putative phage head morphogenesis protein